MGNKIYAMEYALKILLYRRRIFELLEIASKGDLVSKITDLFLISLIFLSVIAIVLESVQSINEKFYFIFYWFEIISVVIFTVEYVLRIWSCVENSKYISSSTSNFKSRLHYMTSLEAIVDLLAILPFYLVLIGVFGNVDMRFLRSFRLLRIFKLTRYSSSFEILIRVFKENLSSFGAAFFILIVVMLLAATGMYYFEHSSQPKAFGSILSSMWWAFATLTTVGYGDVTPITTGGKTFGALITVLGVGMVALPTAILASAFSEQLRIRSRNYENHADKAFEDGILTADEIEELEGLREELGLSKGAAGQIIENRKQKSNLKLQHQCPHCGNEITILEQFKNVS